jgi:phage terminase small subunit
MKLTEKQKRFADEYIISGNATQAAIKAGYSKKTANRIATENLSKLVIKNYIDERLAKLESKRIANAQEVLEYLTGVMRGDEKEEVMTEDGVSYREPSVKDKLKAAELLGKRHALFTEKQEISANVASTKLDDIISQIGGDGLDE